MHSEPPEDAGTRIRPYRRLPSEQRRDEILAAAITAFSANPNASLSDVAKAAGVSRASLYRFFETRQDLLHAAFRAAGDGLVARVREMPEGPPSLILMTRLKHFLDHIEQHEAMFVGFLQTGSTLATDEIRAIADHVRNQIGQMVYQTLEITDVTPLLETTVRSWVAGVEGTAINWLRTRQPSRDDIELILSSQLGVMLFSTASYDPAVAERIGWWMRREPADGLWAFHVRSMARVFNLDLFSNMTRLLSDSNP